MNGFDDEIRLFKKISNGDTTLQKTKKYQNKYESHMTEAKKTKTKTNKQKKQIKCIIQY